MSYPDTAHSPAGFLSASWRVLKKRRMTLTAVESCWLCVCVYIFRLVGWLLVAFDTLPRREETEKKKKKLILRPDWIQPQLKRTTQEGRAFLFPTGDQNGRDGARYNIQTHTERENYMVVVVLRVAYRSSSWKGGGEISEQKISHAMVVVEDESRAHPE